MRNRRSFFLIEILVGCALITVVAISIFSLENKMTSGVRKATQYLQQTTAYNRALSSLVEMLTQKTIAVDAITKQQSIEYDLEMGNWKSRYTFKIIKSSPEHGANLFLVETKVCVFDSNDENSIKEGNFNFCLSTKGKTS